MLFWEIHLKMILFGLGLNFIKRQIKFCYGIRQIKWLLGANVGNLGVIFKEKTGYSEQSLHFVGNWQGREEVLGWHFLWFPANQTLQVWVVFLPTWESKAGAHSPYISFPFSKVTGIRSFAQRTQFTDLMTHGKYVDLSSFLRFSLMYLVLLPRFNWCLLMSIH